VLVIIYILLKKNFIFENHSYFEHYFVTFTYALHLNQLIQSLLSQDKRSEMLPETTINACYKKLKISLN